jgi:hypothetical protein
MKLNSEPGLPQNPPAGYHADLSWKLTQLLRAFVSQLNGLSDGHVSASTTASTAAPTTGKHARGDFVRNTEPSEAGIAGSKYVITGWICTVSGTPGTWVACRSLTGN